MRLARLPLGLALFSGISPAKKISTTSRFEPPPLISMMEELLVKKLTDNAVLPCRGSVEAAGFDLSSAYDTVVPAKGKALVKTDLAIAIPENTYARIAPRSGLAWKNFIDVGAGVVDYDYRGNVGVVLFNHGEDDLEVKHGDRVAQLILERISMAPIREVDDLPTTERGAGGFGSTGVAQTNGEESKTVSDSNQAMKAASTMDSSGVEELLVKKITENAILPSRGSADAAGFDLASAYDAVVPAKGKALVKTDLAIAIPPNTYARIAPRSGLAWKKFIDLGAGVVDYDYRGNVGVVMFNHGDEDLIVSRGDRIAQLVLERISMAHLREVSELLETKRGAGGFGSTGVAQNNDSGNEQKVRIVSPTDHTKGDMLVMLHGIGAATCEQACWQNHSPAFGSYEEAKQKLKPLALDGNEKLEAAFQAFAKTNDVEDLVDTLAVIILGSKNGGSS